MRKAGRLSSWDDDKGFGFIEPDDGSARVFIHIKAFRSRDRRPVVGDVVSFSMSRDEKGRPRAVSARLAGATSPGTHGRKSRAPAILFALAFLAAVGASVVFTGLPPLILVAYLAASVITFFAYAIDKSAARNARRRIKESTLHFFALAGGWPGALIAQQTLRHKSKKQSFRGGLVVTVILNCVAFAWLHTPDGRVALLQALATIS